MAQSLHLVHFVGAFVVAAAQVHTFEAGGENSFVREGYTNVADETRKLMNNFKWVRWFYSYARRQHGTLGI